jgi:hypothetical protein
MSDGTEVVDAFEDCELYKRNESYGSHMSLGETTLILLQSFLND